LTSAAPSHGKMMTHARRAWHGWAMEVVLWSTVTVAGTEIAHRLHVSAEAVSRIRRRFPDTGVAGLATRPKAGRKDPAAATVERLVTRPVAAGWAQALDHAAPRAGSRPHQRLCIRRVAPQRAQAAAGAQRQKVSRDPDFVAKVRDSVGLYLNPPEPSFRKANQHRTSAMGRSDSLARLHRYGIVPSCIPSCPLHAPFMRPIGP
jgi:transposase